jgi:hypothetical protein
MSPPRGFAGLNDVIATNMLPLRGLPGLGLSLKSVIIRKQEQEK